MFPIHKPKEDRDHPCPDCGQLFRSKVGLRRHLTYVCHNQQLVCESARARTEHKHTITLTHEEDPLTRHDEGQARAYHEEAYHEDAYHEPQTSTYQDVSEQTELPPVTAKHPNIDRVQNSEMIQEEGRQEQVPDAYPPASISNQLQDLSRSRPFICEHCEKPFSEPADLTQHLRHCHQGARQHACTECGKTFATSSGLKQHQHIHSSVKPFQCEVCLRAYTQFSNLCRHKRMHADCRQQIKCKDCGQAFSTTTSLSKHKRFCEGVMRSAAGRSFGFPAQGVTDKASPLAPSVSQASPLMAAYMNMYSARPAFPFYPPLTPGFSMFPPGHPLATMMPHGMMDGKHFPVSDPGQSPPPSEHREDSQRHAMDKKDKLAISEASELTDASDISSTSDFETAGSDAESDLGGERRHSGIIKTSVPSAIPASFHYRAGAEFPARKLNPYHSAKPSTHTPKPYNLSKDATSSGEQPLDLSVKVKVDEVEENPRKTHIFGKEKVVTPPKEEPAVVEKQKLHSAYPITPPLMMDRMYPNMDKDKMQTFQEAARVMQNFPRFPLPTPPFSPLNHMHGLGMGGLGLLTTNPMGMAKTMSPMMKLDRSPTTFPYSSAMHGKMKDRYSCKFCGKVFPRSANLTRHLRTHTGEQPYKCKYCERSFSISSNLQRHVRNIHNKEKPFKCHLCDRCFGQQTNLDRHLKKHETEGPNVVDSPEHTLVEEPEENGFSSKDNSYYDEVGSMSHKSGCSPPISPDKLSSREDVHPFSIAAQLRHSSPRHSPPRMEEEEDEEDYHPDVEDVDELEARERVIKRAKLQDNNNTESPPEKSISELATGFLSHNHHSDVFSQYLSNYTSSLKGVTKPLACTT